MKAIDLGLPSGLLWCDKNIGTANEEDAGLYFKWGDKSLIRKECVARYILTKGNIAMTARMYWITEMRYTA